MTTRVLIVDDSVVIRRMLTNIVAEAPDLEVASIAATGAIALQKIEQATPDVVLLDVEMPDMDGIETVSTIRRRWPRLPVVMCSSLTARGADTTLRALAAGATDYIAKPSASRGEALSGFGAELVAKIHALAGARRMAPTTPKPAPRVVPVVSAGPTGPIDAIVIGSSTGGPNALADVFKAFPKNFPLPIFVVQHMPPLFTRLLAERLTATSNIKVHEAQDGQMIVPGEAYIAPGNFHMRLAGIRMAPRVALDQGAPENSCRPAVDVLFRSVAQLYGKGVLGAVLTGMGHDGAKGAQAIVAAGGRVLAQEASTCVVPSMPMSVVEAGAADGVYPLDLIGMEIVMRTERSRGLKKGGS